MTPLQCHVPDHIAKQAHQRAKQAGLDLSRYLTELIQHDVALHAEWPEGYFELFGQWEGARLERPESLPLEERLELK